MMVDDLMIMSNFGFPNFPQRRPSPGWVPIAGTKRKAQLAGIVETCDSEQCGPAPAKQCIIDPRISREYLPGQDPYPEGIIQDATAATAHVKQFPTEDYDEEMEYALESTDLYQKGPGEESKFSTESACDEVNKDDKLDGKKCEDSRKNLHEFQPVSGASVKSNLSSMNGVSLVLSDEIQETLARRRLNEDLILPKLITDKVREANSMAVVLWKPPVIGPLGVVRKEVATPTSTPTTMKRVPEVTEEVFPCSPLKNTFELNRNEESLGASIPAHISLTTQPISPINIEDECVEMDITP